MPLSLRKMIAVLTLSLLSMAGHAALSVSEQQKLDTVVTQLNQLPKVQNKYTSQAIYFFIVPSSSEFSSYVIVWSAGTIP